MQTKMPHCRVSFEIQRKVKFEDVYTTLEDLGRGSFGIVKKCEHNETKNKYAAKFIRKTSKNKNDVYREIEILSRVNHPRLVQFNDAFETLRQIIIVMEYIKGQELFEILAQEEEMNLTENQVSRYIKQILEGLYYMHSQNIVHLDLKPENLICVGDPKTGSEQIKVIDFGLAREIKNGGDDTVICGTAEFVAPEVIAYEPVTQFTDMWSLGVITYVLVSGLSPFLGDNDLETYQNITEGSYSFEEEDEIFEIISDDGKKFISELLVKNPKKRLSASHSLEHTWLMSDDKEAVIDKTNLRQFIARRKWKTTISAIKAVGRFTTGSTIFRDRTFDEGKEAVIDNKSFDSTIKNMPEGNEANASSEQINFNGEINGENPITITPISNGSCDTSSDTTNDGETSNDELIKNISKLVKKQTSLNDETNIDPTNDEKKNDPSLSLNNNTEQINGQIASSISSMDVASAGSIDQEVKKILHSMNKKTKSKSLKKSEQWAMITEKKESKTPLRSDLNNNIRSQRNQSLYGRKTSFEEKFTANKSDQRETLQTQSPIKGYRSQSLKEKFGEGNIFTNKTANSCSSPAQDNRRSDLQSTRTVRQGSVKARLAAYNAKISN